MASPLRARLDKVNASMAKPMQYNLAWAPGYIPRDVFQEFHKRKQRWAVVVAHRRCGKTVACINELIKYCVNDTSKMGRYAYISPYFNQSKQVAWDYVKQFTRGIKGTKVNEAELRVDFANGARLQLFGADNADRLRGLFFNGIICDEYADFKPSVWTYVIRPALADKMGWAVLIGTPRGKNSFFDRYTQAANGEGDWFAVKIKASESGILPESEIVALKSEMSEMAWRQEMECDFEIPVQGAYYAEGLEAAKAEGRIGNVAADPLMTIRSFWDIGGTGARADSCAIWIAQFIGREIRVLNYYEAQGQPLASHVNWLRSNGYDKIQCVLPHDGVQHDKVYQVTYESALQEAGFDAFVVKNQGAGAATQRIEAARRLFGTMWFNSNQGCLDGLDTLAMYKEKRDELRNIGLGPEHDAASHCGDAFGLMAVAHPMLVDTAWGKLDYSATSMGII
jgi:phage terminase large subunit